MTQATVSPAVITTKDELLKYVDQQCVDASSNIPYVDLDHYEFDSYAEELLAARYAELYRVVPLARVDGRLVVAMDDKVNVYETTNTLEFISGLHLEVFKAESLAVDECIDRLYTTEELVGVPATHERVKPVDLHYVDLLRRKAREKPIVKIVRRMLLEALRKHASDIHIRPTEKGFDYLLRINGNMTFRSSLQKDNLHAVVSRFKILGGMNITEHRIPQDGGVKLNIGGHTLELRLSVMPTIHGESLVVRLLNRDAALFHLKELGLEAKEYESVYRASKLSHGLVVVAGPTGSGKSTTLYALLQEIKQNSHLNIITVEDPVEFHIDDIEQIQVNQKTGYTFATALRNILRHDPDIIMVGEIRDEETAKMAVECALTGHLVLTTLHSVNALSSVTRLLEMGLPPYLLKATLSLVVAQRLAKLNCPHCLTDDKSEEAQLLQKDPQLSHITWKVSPGCPACHFSGINGRKGIYESLEVSDEVQAAIKEGVTEQSLRDIVDSTSSLQESAKRLLESGQICAREWLALQLG